MVNNYQASLDKKSRASCSVGSRYVQRPFSRRRMTTETGGSSASSLRQTMRFTASQSFSIAATYTSTAGRVNLEG